MCTSKRGITWSEPFKHMAQLIVGPRTRTMIFLVGGTLRSDVKRFSFCAAWARMSRSSCTSRLLTLQDHSNQLSCSRCRSVQQQPSRSGSVSLPPDAAPQIFAKQLNVKLLRPNEVMIYECYAHSKTFPRRFPIHSSICRAVYTVSIIG